MENEYKKVFEMVDFKSMEEFKMVMSQFEKDIIKKLIERCGKSEKEATHSLQQFQLWDKVKKSPLLLHESPEKISLIIMTGEDDVDAINQFYQN